jgi:hypothetical protein
MSNYLGMSNSLLNSIHCENEIEKKKFVSFPFGNVFDDANTTHLTTLINLYNNVFDLQFGY